MIEKMLTFVRPSVAIVLGLSLITSCSKEKEEVAAAEVGKPDAAAAPQVDLREPEVKSEAAVKPAAVAPAKPAPAGSVVFVGRLESFVRQASRSLWQTVKTTGEPQQYALISPKAGSGDLSKVLVAGGPENLALGLGDALLRTTDGQPVFVGQDYQFTLSAGSAEGVWMIEIAPAP
jgi:hypothetical protein